MRRTKEIYLRARKRIYGPSARFEKDKAMFDGLYRSKVEAVTTDIRWWLSHNPYSQKAVY